ERMVALAEEARRVRKVANLEFRVGDLMATEVADQSVDAVTVSYGLRNCPDVRRGLGEIHRMLRPGGCLASLDFVRLGDPWQEFLFENGLLLGCNVLGWLWHREPAAYGYLAKSIKYFVTNKEFKQTLRRTGFQVVVERPKLAGALYLHLAEK